MKQNQLEALQAKITESPQLSQLAAALREAVFIRLGGVVAEPRNIALDPITILMIISIVIQIIYLCRTRNNRSETEIFADVRAISTAPLRRTIRLRRRLNLLWAEYCKNHGLADTGFNPFLSGIYAVSPTIDGGTFAEVLSLSDY